jgi:hypothetical protein
LQDDYLSLYGGSAEDNMGNTISLFGGSAVAVTSNDMIINGEETS